MKSKLLDFMLDDLDYFVFCVYNTLFLEHAFVSINFIKY